MNALLVKPHETEIGPLQNGVVMTPTEFDCAEFEQGWRYELIHGVLVVSPIPLEQEADPNEELGRLLRNYQEFHPQGKALDKTLSERLVKVGDNRRRPDRVVWAGLGRRPKRDELPTIVIEFVSEGRRNWMRDYIEKRDEYLGLGVGEYWIVDRFQRNLTVYRLEKGKPKKKAYRDNQEFKTPLLPGFELPLSRLFQLADEWAEEES